MVRSWLEHSSGQLLGDVALPEQRPGGRYDNGAGDAPAIHAVVLAKAPIFGDEGFTTVCGIAPSFFLPGCRFSFWMTCPFVESKVMVPGRLKLEIPHPAG